ncbi:MAG: hypothetical protein NT154_21240 [Verrucomicrobia bacterium]|nr:hypothetical protein [Verrucomicrobiota bacterium]
MSTPHFIIKFQIGFDAECVELLRTIAGVLTQTDARLSEIQQQGELMSKELQTLKDQVAANNTLVESAITLIGGLATQIEALKQDPVALQGLADSLRAEDTKLAAALAANITPEP